MTALRCDEALRFARRDGVDHLDAQLLMARVLGTSRSAVIAHGERLLQPAEQATWQGWIERRSAGEPLAYLLGEKEFYGLPMAITADVLVPRPETELLVDLALAALAPDPTAPAVVDLGTGSGAIALAIKHRRPDARVTATDISLPALGLAAGNADRLRLDLELVAGGWWQAVDGRRFHAVVANPPYIAAADPHLSALGHEPRAALTPGGDGLAALLEIIGGASAHLEPDGWLLLEHGHDQDERVRLEMTEAGLVEARTHADLAGLPRVTTARRPSPAA
jgi:release factor glutamine methyltransferase